MGLIEIEGMQFFAYHGHFQAEQLVGNNFEVQLQIKTNCSKAAKSDNLNDALNYQEVYKQVQAEMQITSKLLEHVASRILDRLYGSFPEIEWLSVKISKLNPPMGGEIEKVSVTLSR